jgi:tRNA nucleotidyltransferase (CCA-adding enzyme)
VDRYRGEWRSVQAELTGNDLKALGFVPGPHYKEILRSLRAQRLDGTIINREQEENYVLSKM